MPRALAALLAAAAFAGCAPSGGSKDSSGRFRGEQRLVANAVEDFESAARKGNQDQICREDLARTLIDRLSRAGRNCAGAVDAALKDTDSFDLTVQSVQIRGTRASARVKAEAGKRDRIDELALVKERGGWRIAAFAGP